MKKQFLILFLLFLIIGVGCSKRNQKRNIKGHVYILNEFGDKATKEGVTITINGAEKSYVATTDLAGDYIFEDIFIEDFEVVFEKENVGKYIYYKNYSDSIMEGFGWNLNYFGSTRLTEKSSATVSNLQIDTITYAGNTIISEPLGGGISVFKLINHKVLIFFSGNVSQVGENLTSFFIYLGNQNVSSENYYAIITPTLEPLYYTGNFEYDESGNFTYQDTVIFSPTQYNQLTTEVPHQMIGEINLYAIAHAVPGKFLYEKRLWFDTYLNPSTGDTIYPGLGKSSNRAFRKDSILIPFPS